MEYAAIVIAAGLSSRMGYFKPLLDIGGKPALTRLLDSISTAGLSRTCVVTGHGHETVEAALPPGCIAVYNADYENGMFSSIQAGIEKATETDAALLFPVDVPLVAPETIKGLVAEWEKGDVSRFAVPEFEGKNGHPLLIPRAYFGAILDYTGEGGLKEIRNRYISEMLRYETNDRGCVLDMDTPEDYNQLLSYYGGLTNE